MIPIRDDAPRSTTPYVTYFLIVLNVLVFVFEILLAPDARDVLVRQFGVVPVHITGLLHGSDVTGAGWLNLLPILTSMFLHASWGHVLANMWALWLFGDNIEDHLGHFRYLVLYFICGIAAGLVQIVASPNSNVPTVGASGAIAGVMGAYFLLFPSARVLIFFPIFFLFWLPAWLVLGYWFVVQFLSGAATAIVPSTQNAGGIAFWAHVGGFLCGVALIKLFPQRARRYTYANWE
jgi:membrane associated rhomboid family serine protease